MLLNSLNNEIMVFNSSDIQNIQNLYEPGFVVKLYKNKIENSFNIIYNLQKQTQDTSLMVVAETSTLLSEITLYEVFTPQIREEDFLSNLRWPIIGIAIALAIGWQFWVKKKDKGQDSQKFTDKDFEELTKKMNLKDEIKEVAAQEEEVEP